MSPALLQIIATAGATITAAAIGYWASKQQRKQTQISSLLEALQQDNKDLREENRNLRDEITGLRKGQRR